jgi:hypothetical protein
MIDQEEDKPPLFASWKSWYLLVLLFLAALIILFTFLTKYFA